MTPLAIIIIGMRASGKTTFGRQLALAMDLPFIDSDEQIEKSTTKSIHSIFKDTGEENFRLIEENIVERILNSHKTPFILATGGGTIESEETQKRISEHFIIWLNTDISTIENRLSEENEKGQRPQLKDSTQQIYHSRLPIYDKLANLVVHPQKESFDKYVEEITLAYTKATKGKIHDVE